MLCVKIEDTVKVILVYKKPIDLIQAPDYIFITPFDNRVDLSILIDQSISHFVAFNSANYKLILSCYGNNQEDITLKPEYDVFENKEIYNKNKNEPLQYNNLHVYHVSGSAPKMYLFSRFSMSVIKRKYKEYNLDSKALKNLKEIPFSITMINLFSDISDLCRIKQCVTFNDYLAKRLYYLIKLKYTDLITRNNYKNKKLSFNKYKPPPKYEKT